MTSPRQRRRSMVPPTSRTFRQDAIADLRHGAPRRVVTDAVARFASGLAPDARVVEVGAGHYNYSSWFATQRLVTFDADETQSPDVLADALVMPFASQSVDAVLAISVLEHVNNPYSVVAEIARILAPDGRVLAWVPFYFARHGFPSDITRFTREGLEECFRQAGLVVDLADTGPYEGLFFHATNQVHFLFPRNHRRRWMRWANRVLFLIARALFPLDRRLRVATMYAGTELIAHKPAMAGVSPDPQPQFRVRRTTRS